MKIKHEANEVQQIEITMNGAFEQHGSFKKISNKKDIFIQNLTFLGHTTRKGGLETLTLTRHIDGKWDRVTLKSMADSKMINIVKSYKR